MRFRRKDANLSDSSTFPAQLVVMQEIAQASVKAEQENAQKAFKYLLAKRSVYEAAKCMLSGDEVKGAKLTLNPSTPVILVVQ